MPLVVGIDEAGYGPLLGPLVIAATTWQVRPECVERDFWELLATCVRRASQRDEARLIIDDSKRVFHQSHGLEALERTVLAFLAAQGVAVDRLDQLLAAVAASPAIDDPNPWYRDLGARLPIGGVRCGVRFVAERLRGCFDLAGAECRVLRAEIVSEHAFNRRVAQTRNKGALVVEVVLRLIHSAVLAARDQDVYARVDRLGGRADYRGLLMSAFPDRHLHILDVSDELSRYRLAGPGNDVFVEFRVDADQRHLPVALASMLAKYLREVLMRQFNAFWRRFQHDLAPTAGYYNDAQRFLDEIRPLAAGAGVRLEDMLRAR